MKEKYKKRSLEFHNGFVKPYIGKIKGLLQKEYIQETQEEENNDN